MATESQDCQSALCEGGNEPSALPLGHPPPQYWLFSWVVGAELLPRLMIFNQWQLFRQGAKRVCRAPQVARMCGAASLGARAGRAGYSLAQPGWFVAAHRLQGSRRFAVPTHKAPAILPLLPALMQLGLRWVQGQSLRQMRSQS